jgi:branched-subunit amino acid transport protein
MEREEMSNIWVIMIAVGILTYLTRLSFILLLDKWQPPEIVTRALRYVPVAVLTAIIVPELVVVDNALDFSLGNARMLAGIVAILVAWRTRSALWTIAVGFAAFLLLNAWLV